MNTCDHDLSMLYMYSNHASYQNTFLLTIWEQNVPQINMTSPPPFSDIWRQIKIF